MKSYIALAISIAAVIAFAQPAAAAGVPNPTVMGPIPATVSPGDPSHDYPFSATNIDLARYGYIEEEFFFQGVANRYNTPTLATGTVISGGHFYRTRMVVRRPASPARFNGTVVMEWLNAKGTSEVQPGWIEMSTHFIRRGYAWIGVSAQRAGIHQAGTGLKAWSPARYGTLDVTANGTILDDSLCYDIFSQAVQAVKSPVGIDVMGGLLVERVFAAGASASSVRLITYHNSIHPLAGVVDGFMLIHGGRPVRTDLDVKVFKTFSETEIWNNAPANVRQPDSTNFREWEVAGASHMDFYFSQHTAELAERDFGSASTPPICSRPPLSRIPERYIGHAILEHLVRWVRDNIAPPAAPPLETLPGPPVTLVRDAFGNALGGVRLPQHAVPTAVNTGENSGPGYCDIYGSYEPFDAATLQSLYPDHGAYVSRVVEATLDCLEKGYMVMEDAAETIGEAARSGVGRAQP